MRKLFFLLIVMFFISCSYNRVIILDHQVIDSKKISGCKTKSDTIRMITLESGEVITHDELSRRFDRAIETFKKKSN
jgi:hypothetical protein